MTSKPYVGQRVLTPSREYGTVVDYESGWCVEVQVRYSDGSTEWLLIRSVRFV